MREYYRGPNTTEYQSMDEAFPNAPQYQCVRLTCRHQTGFPLFRG